MPVHADAACEKPIIAAAVKAITAFASVGFIVAFPLF
jgi:hypothetical protein